MTPSGINMGGGAPKHTPIAELHTRYGYIDHLLRVGVDLRGRVHTSKDGLNCVDAATADECGSLALQELADELDEMVVVAGGSQFHEGKCFVPRGTIAEAQPRQGEPK